MNSMAQESETNECPTCGRDDFASEQGMKQHHARTHGESIANPHVEYECDWCGSLDTKHKSEYEKRDNHFCTNECMGAWYSENKSKENHSCWEGGGIEYECDWCGEADRKSENQYERSDNLFCSRSCKGEWMSESFSGKDSWSWKGGGIDYECDWCGETDTKPENQVQQNRWLFCSRGCYSSWLSENRTGENHPMFGRTGSEAPNYGNTGEDHPGWRGGYPETYGTRWDAIRESIRERDDHTCQRCGVESDGKAHDVHHITPIRLFRVWSKVEDDVEIDHGNAHRNLVTLCHACNMKVDFGDAVSPVPDSHWRSE